MDVLTLRLRALSDRLQSSLLVVPSFMLIAAVVLVFVANEIDDRTDPSAIPDWLKLEPAAAISLLGTVAGATITTAGVVFSLLVVSLQLASGQFSPRVLRGFYRHRLGQIVIGLLMATFTYCVLALPRIDSESEHAPSLTIALAMVLGLASIVAIVAYLDQISRRQYVGSIVERIATETLELVHGLPQLSHPAVSPAARPDVSKLGEPFLVPSPAEGWVQQLSHRVLLTAVPPGSTVRFETRVGAYVVEEAPLASVWPTPANPAEVIHKLADGVIIGDVRTMQQDIDFGLRQLNDVALRALSPAVNDPTTAIEVVMRVASIMRPLLLTELPPQAVRYQSHDAVTTLLTPWDIDHVEYVQHAFGQLRHACANQLNVAMALVRTLRMLADTCALIDNRENVIAELEQQISLTMEECRHAGLLDSDVARVKEAGMRHQEVLILR